jgi:thiol-disulfide isomerase/thioredoxin
MNWITQNWKFIAIGVAVVIVLATIAYFYTKNSGFMVKQGFQNAVDAKHEFIMFYAEWCPHCKTAMPDFDKLAESSITVAGQPIKISKYDNASEDPVHKKAFEDIKAKGVDVKGFPTFVLITADGKTVEHKGERNIAAYTKFLNDTLGGGI